MKKVFYNVWFKLMNRWTTNTLNHCRNINYSQDQYHPALLTKIDAEELMRQILEGHEYHSFHYEVRPIKIEKIIPDFPLDPTLHVLQAGYIQDRQRKRS